MDIKHLEYFVEVVKSDCNLSVASKNLGISQPALSATIKNFEQSKNVTLFVRSKGRLQSLTPTGERFYSNALTLLETYSTMIEDLKEKTPHFMGVIRIGIPPFLAGPIIATVLARLIEDNPSIRFELVEANAYDLNKLLLLNELDFAILLQSNILNPDAITEYKLKDSELLAFMSVNHPLARETKLTWKQLDGRSMVLFNEGFMIYHHLKQLFKKENISPRIALTPSSWDFLVLMTKGTNFITILPANIKPIFHDDGIIDVPFENPVSWNVFLCQPQKSNYSHAEQHVLASIIELMKEI